MAMKKNNPWRADVDSPQGDTITTGLAAVARTTNGAPAGSVQQSARSSDAIDESL
jgi:hypothetical protein